MKKRFTLFFIPLLFSLFITAFSYAQSEKGLGKISGKIIDNTAQPFAFVTVCLYKKSDTTLIKQSFTTLNGEFVFEEVMIGIYLISADAMGQKKTFSKPFSIDGQKEEKKLAWLQLMPDERELNTVMISSKKSLVTHKNGKVILNVAGSILATGNTAMEILAKAPGVTMDREGNISLRGKSGVEVMINGKPTYLSTDRLTALLRATNGNNIETIELMSQPPASYDAAGSAGIINIKLKKEDNYGTNGNVFAGAGYGRYYKSNGGISLNHRTKHFNIFGNYDYLNNKEYQDLKITRSNTLAEEKTSFDQKSLEVTTIKNNSYKAGIDYSINDKTIVGLVTNGDVNNNSSINDNFTAIGNQPGKIDSTLRATNPGRTEHKNQSYNINLKSVLDTIGQEFSADIDYSQFRSNNETVYNNMFYDVIGNSLKTPYIFRNATPSTVKIWAGKIDYVYPISHKTKLETGIKSSEVHTDNYFQFDNFIANNWQNDQDKSNRFIYKEQINATYANLNTTIHATTIQLGLRAELTHSEGNSPTTQTKVKRSYFNLFPNLLVNHKLSEQHDLGISFSRRIDRPDYQSLNPFLYYSDLYTFNQGNPLLKPQYTNSFELTYGYKKIYNATLGYSRTTDVITTTLISDTIAKTLIIKDQNLASQQTLNINVNVPLTFNKWWNTTNDITLYHTIFDTPDLLGSPFNSKKTTFLINSIHSFTLTPAINADLSINYQSTEAYGTYLLKPIYSIDIGISKSFADKRASLKLAANDVFNFAQARVRSAIKTQDYQLYQKQETRIFRLTFSYSFGSSQIKGVRERSKSSENEETRAKNGN